jgi:hypothetical protein
LAKTHNVKTVVLRKNIDEEEAMEIVNQKKTKPFKSLLSRPKPEQVHVHSLKLFHECILMVSGKYVADYYRKATHSISVNYNIRDVVLGGGLFPIRSKSGFAKALSGKRGKNKIDLKLEEHVFIEEEDELTFDLHGHEIKFPFKINSKTIENYPKRILEKNQQNVKKPEITYDTAIEKLQLQLKKPAETDIRDLTDEFVLREITEVYIPIFEARLIGPKKKVELLRIDAVRKKVL